MRIIGLALLLFASPALAAQICNATTAGGQFIDCVPTQPQDVIHASSTTTNGTTSATANTFTSVLSANASRKGCTIVNTSAVTEQIYLGSPTNATLAQSTPLAAGGTFNCGTYQGVVLSDQISITSATASSPYVAIVQSTVS